MTDTIQVTRPRTRPTRRARGWLRRVGPWTWAWVALAVVTLLVVVGDDAGVFAPDTKPELYLNPDRLLGRALSVWQPDPHLGQANYNTGILPVAALMTAVQATGLPPWLMQRLFMVVLLLVGAWGAGRLVTELSERTGAGPWLAGAVYAWHPWVVVGAATLPVRLPHAVLPWLLLATHRAVRRGGWGPAAAAALTYAAMAGINGGVVNLMLAPAIPAMAAWTAWSYGTGARRAAEAVARIGVLAVGVSLYWLVPSLVASDSAASSVLLATEDPVGIARLSSPSEVVRGMGMWTQYVVLDGQIENPAQLRFLTSGVVGLATFGVVVAATVLLTRLRRDLRVLAGGAVLLGVVGMVGLNASGGRGVLGAALEWLFLHVPVTAAFRTTHKVGSVLVLGLALAVGAGVATLTADRGGGWSRRHAVVGVVAILAVGAGPLVPAQLHPLQMDVPDHWSQAAEALDRADAGRLWFLPGNAATRYLWDYRHVDDVDTALFDERHVVWRPTIPNGSRDAVNLLTAADTHLNLGSLSPTATRNLAGLVGADELLARTDVDWVRTHGAPSSEVRDRAVAAATGPPREFGDTADARGLDASLVDPDDRALTAVPVGPTAIVQARPLVAPLLVVGDAFGVAALDEAIGDRPVLYLDDLTDDQLSDALAAGGELVVTDTNHRRRWAVNSTSDGYTPLLGPDAELAPVDLRARSLDPDDQTVALPLPVEVTARPEPYDLVHRRAAGRPEFAFDGDLTTTWQYGRRESGVGGWWQLALPTPARVDEVRVLVDQSDKRVTRLELTTEQGTLARPVVDGIATFPVGEDVQRLRLTIEGTEGFTTSAAGIREVIVTSGDDLFEPVVPGARLPLTLAHRVAEAGADLEAIEQAPLRIVLTRLQGAVDDAFDDEEIRLRRRIELGRTVEVEATGISAVVRWPEAVEAGTCVTVARVGDTDVRVAPVQDAAEGEPVDGRGCGPLSLPADPVELVAEPGHVLDRLELVDHAGSEPGASAPVVTVVAEDRTSLSVRTSSDVPVVLSSGRARHPGWRASIDGGDDLASSVLANGYAAGWIVPAGTHEVAITFAPQGPTRAAQWASLGAAVAAVALLLVRRRRS